MPIPTLHIHDEAPGQPRQPVPPRPASFDTGLSCADFRYLLAVLRNDDEQHLPACE